MATASSPSSSHRRTWLRLLLVAMGVLLLLYLGTSFLLSRFLDPEALADWLEPRMEEVLNRDVEVARVEVGFLPLGVRFQDVTVADPTELAPELAHVGSLELRVAVLPLLRREVRVNRLAIEEFRADLRVGEDGRSNFGDLSTRQPEEAGPQARPEEAGERTSETEARTSEAGAATEEGERPGEAGSQATGEGSGGSRPFALDLRSIRIRDSSLGYAGAGDELRAQLTELELDASARRSDEGGWSLAGSTGGEATVQRGDAPPILQETPLELVFDAETDGRMERLAIRDGELRLGQIALALTGEVDRLQDPVRSLSLALAGEGLPLPDLLALLPDSIRGQVPVEAEGSLAVDLRAQGEAGPGTLPAVTGSVSLTQGRISLDGSRIAEDLTADLELMADNAVQTRSQATLLGGPVSMEGTATLEGEPRVDLLVRAGPVLDRLASVVELPDGVDAQGEITTDVRITGPAGDLRGLRFRGNVRTVNLRATHPGLGVPVEVARGEVELDGTRAILRDLPIQLGEDRLVLTGELANLLAFLAPGETPRFDGAVRANRLQLAKLTTRPLPDSSLTYGKVAFAKVGGRSVGERTVQQAAEELGLSRPDSLPLAGRLDVTVDTLIDNQGRMENLQAQVEFGPSFLQVSQATFRRYGGEISTSADLSLAADEAAPFSLSLQLESLDAGSFLSETTPLGRFLRGTVSGEIDLIGTLDGFLLPDRPALVGSGSFSLTGGGLASVPLTRRISDFLGLEALREPSFRDWAGSFLLEEGRVRLAESTLQGAPGSPTVGGSVGLDGELDLRSVFDLPSERLDASALERLGVAGEIAANVAQRPDVVQAVLRIGGSVFDPSVEADPASAVRTVGQAVEEEARAEVQEAVEAQKAEAQRRIEEQKEELRNRATGFLRNLIQRDTARPDTTRPDTVRPDTMRPDTVRPDTTRPDTMRPDTVRPDTTRPDTMRPDTVRPDTTRPDTMRPDTVRPDTTRRDTIPPETRGPDMTPLHGVGRDAFEPGAPRRGVERGTSAPQ